jgi:hypothetical protein
VLLLLGCGKALGLVRPSDMAQGKHIVRISIKMERRDPVILFWVISYMGDGGSYLVVKHRAPWCNIFERKCFRVT